MNQFTSEEKKAFIAPILEGWSQESWCAGHTAEDAEGKQVLFSAPTAVKWCVIGRFLRRSNAYKGYLEEMDLRQEIYLDFNKKYCLDIADTSDNRGFAVIKEQLENLYTEETNAN